MLAGRGTAYVTVVALKNDEGKPTRSSSIELGYR